MSSILPDDPVTIFWKKYLGGVTLPLALAANGIYAVVTQHAVIPSRSTGLVHLYGAAAIACGISLLGAALALHAYFWWENDERLNRFSEAGQFVGIVILLGGIGFMLYTMIVS